MLIDFFLHLRAAKLPVSVKEYLMLLEAMGKGVIGPSIDDFYHLSRASLVKDERNFDKFDRAFGTYFKGVQSIPGIELDLPLDWLQRQFQREFTAEEKAAVEALGGDDVELVKHRAQVDGLEALAGELRSERDVWREQAARSDEAARELRVLVRQAQTLAQALPATTGQASEEGEHAPSARWQAPPQDAQAWRRRPWWKLWCG